MQRSLHDGPAPAEQVAAVAAVLMGIDLGGGSAMGGHEAKRLARLSGATVGQAETVARNLAFAVSKGEVRKTPMAYVSHALLTGRWTLDGRIAEAAARERVMAKRAAAADREAEREAAEAAASARRAGKTEARLAAMGEDEVASVCDAVLADGALTLPALTRRELEGRRVDRPSARAVVLRWLRKAGR